MTSRRFSFCIVYAIKALLINFYLSYLEVASSYKSLNSGSGCLLYTRRGLLLLALREIRRRNDTDTTTAALELEARS